MKFGPYFRSSHLLISLGFWAFTATSLEPTKSSLSKTPGTAKFSLSKDGRITLTPAGFRFANITAKQQVSVRDVTKKEAYAWYERFVDLSDKKAQASPDFTPVNNLLRHLLLADALAESIRLKSNEVAPAVKESEQIPEKRKTQLLDEFDKFRAKLKVDSRELVTSESHAPFLVIVDYYDKVLRETIN